MDQEPKKDIIGKLQEQPYHTRVKILWITVVIAAIGLIFLMVNSVKNTIHNAGDNLVKIEAAKFVAESPIEYASVERIERSDTGLKIYINFKNPNSEILNVPKLSDITLRAGKNTLKAEKITDRQGNVFVQKILSNTQNFAIIYFPLTNAKNVVLILNEMFLEKTPNNIFQQTLELNLENISKASNVRD